MVELFDLIHIRIRQLEVEDTEVLLDPFPAH
jgi:hypothetical protein